MENEKKSKYVLPHIHELDGVRGIAVLLVFFHHLCFATVNPIGWNQSVIALYRIFHYGTVGVDIFFVLSGFLITSLLIRGRQSRAYYQDFYWKRALRILPLYMLCMLGVLLFIPGAKGYVLLSALFIANFANVFHISTVGPFWSLAIEEQFYLIWPTVVRRRSVERLGTWALGIAIGVVIARLAAATIGHHNYFLSFLRCDGLAVGALIACRYQEKQKGDLHPIRDNILCLAAVLVGGLLFAAGIGISRANIAYGAAFLQTGIVWSCGGLIGLVIANSGHRLLSPLRSSFLVFFGLISYALYMLQLYVLMAYDHFRGPLAAGDMRGYWMRIFLVLTITIGASLLSRYLVELPALGLRKRVLRHPTESVFHEPLSGHDQ